MWPGPSHRNGARCRRRRAPLLLLRQARAKFAERIEGASSMAMLRGAPSLPKRKQDYTRKFLGAVKRCDSNENPRFTLNRTAFWLLSRASSSRRITSRAHSRCDRQRRPAPGSHRGLSNSSRGSHRWAEGTRPLPNESPEGTVRTPQFSSARSRLSTGI